MPIVSITSNEDIPSAVNEALGHLDLAGVVSGRLVAIKPNDTWASEEDKTAVTQPDTLRAVIRYIKRFEPKELVVTGGAGAAETEDVFRISGMAQVVADENVSFFDHNRPPFKPVELEYAPEKGVSGPQTSVMVNPRVLEYQTLIALNQLKVHRTATVTLALKNIAMSYPAADYYGHPRSEKRHEHCFYDDMHSFIAAMAKRFPIHLAITAGHPAMIGQGPTGGRPVETGVVIASTDALAADVIGARLLGFNLQAVRHLWEADRLGLGESDVDQMEFPALDLKQAFEVFTRAAYGRPLPADYV